MKKILCAILICGLYSLCVQAQCYDFYVKTPNNSNVKACTSGGYSSSQVQDADTYSRTFAISSSYIYEAGTSNYNCHGYAWHVKEGGTKVWINNVGFESNNLNTYWTDGSYSVYNYNSQPHIENLKVNTQDSKVQIDATGLSEGMYYLYVYSGKGARPITHKIIVGH